MEFKTLPQLLAQIRWIFFSMRQKSLTSKSQMNPAPNTPVIDPRELSLWRRAGLQEARGTTKKPSPFFGTVRAQTRRKQQNLEANRVLFLTDKEFKSSPTSRPQKPGGSPEDPEINYRSPKAIKRIFTAASVKTVWMMIRKASLF